MQVESGMFLFWKPDFLALENIFNSPINVLNYCYKKEHIWVHSNEVDEPRAYYTEWSKSEREKQVLYINVCVCVCVCVCMSGLPGSGGKESASNAGDLGSIPGWGRSPGEGSGYPLQYSCLENPMDGGAW